MLQIIGDGQQENFHPCFKAYDIRGRVYFATFNVAYRLERTNAY